MWCVKSDFFSHLWSVPKKKSRQVSLLRWVTLPLIIGIKNKKRNIFFWTASYQNQQKPNSGKSLKSYPEGLSGGVRCVCSFKETQETLVLLHFCSFSTSCGERSISVCRGFRSFPTWPGKKQNLVGDVQQKKLLLFIVRWCSRATRWGTLSNLLGLV